MVYDQPVLPPEVGLRHIWWLITGAVHKAQELPVELGQASGVRAVQYNLPERRERAALFHEPPHLVLRSYR